MKNYSQSAKNTPTVIRGESQLQGQILIDTLSFTFSLSNVYKITDLSNSTNEISIVSSFQELIDYIFNGVFSCEELRGGRNFFDHSITLDQSAGFIAFGGNNSVRDFDGNIKRIVDEKCQIYISGDGCSRLKDFELIKKKLSELDAKITRVDIAFDDFEGKNDIASCEEKFRNGEFITRGTPPKMKKIDDFGSGDGCTNYVGKRESGKMLRVYEKGKQLGDKLSKWVRWELELRSKDREIPLETLTNPREFLAGSYPALSFINDVVQIIKTSREKLRIQYNKLKNIARSQYGKLFNFARHELGLDHQQIFYEFANFDGYPSRLEWSRKSTINQSNKGVITC